MTAPDTIELREFATDRAAGSQVAVRVTLCGICGTDLNSYRTGVLHTPAVCGHEWVGTVADVGPDVTDVLAGTRVVIAVPPPCGRCPECSAGLAEYCRYVVAVARGRDDAAPPHGGFAARIVVDRSRVLPALTELSDIEAAQVEPASVALHGVRRAGIRPGDVVVVQGGGPIGVLAAQCARVVGAAVVLVVEPDAVRRGLALSLGVDQVARPGEEAEQLLHELTGGRSADAVLECAGDPDLVMTAVGFVRRGGTVLLLGYSTAPATMHPGTWLAKEVTLRGAVAFTRDDVHRAMRLMVQGRLRTTPLHSRTVGLSTIGSVFADLSRGGGDDVKVLVDPHR